MCGIAGFVDFRGDSNENTLKSMTNVLGHRGPDDDGYMFEQNQFCQIGLGHKRLSILDLSPLGHQPMHFSNLSIVFNGEIYNFNEIKNELSWLGHIFVSHSDTEVILHAYQRWGVGCVNKFIGMFAIAIYDRSEGVLTLIRDRAGVKPLFWFFDGSIFLFASELKSFHEHNKFTKEIDTDSLAMFLSYGYIPQPNSIFKNAHKLEAGHHLTLKLSDKNIEIVRYWDVEDCYKKPLFELSLEEAICETEKIMRSAFEYRMVSDVPVGVFLSGGYDSSAVVALLQTNMSEKLKTFSIGFYEDGFNEAEYAKLVAEHLGTDHTEYYCTHADAINIIPQLPSVYDEPFGDSSAIPTMLVSKLARKNVTVSLSADGGDEIFAGYEKYNVSMAYLKMFSSLPLGIRKGGRKILDLVNPNTIPYLKNTYNFASRYEKTKQLLLAKNGIEAMKYTSEFFLEKDLSELLNMPYVKHFSYFDSASVRDKDELANMLAIDYKTYMVDDILTKVDRATMSVGLEGREPFMDHRIIEFVSRLPSDFKYRSGEKKYILKKIVHKYLPVSIMDRPKMGFGIPLGKWLNGEIKELAMSYLSSERISEHGLFNELYVRNLCNEFFGGRLEHASKIWFLLMFQMWYEKWMR